MPLSSWRNLDNLTPQKRFTCGHCNLNVGTDKGYYRNDRSNVIIALCPACERPTYFEEDKQMPNVIFGGQVDKLPPEVDSLYKEARNCMAVSCHTAAVLAARKLLMNVAVSQGAPEGDKFIAYVEFLMREGFVPKNAKGWVDHIRQKRNEATHEIALMQRQDAEALLIFIEMLLKLVFEFPGRVPA
jgi:hypothetical protein